MKRFLQQGGVSIALQVLIVLQMITLFFFGAWSGEIYADALRIYVSIAINILLLLLVSVDTVRKKEILIPSHTIDKLIAVFFVIYLIAAGVSQSGIISVFGAHFYATGSVVHILSMLVLYYVARAYITEIYQYLWYIAIIAGLAGVTGLIYLLGTFFATPLLFAATTPFSHLYLLALATVVVYALRVYIKNKKTQHTVVVCTLLVGIYLLLYAPIMTAIIYTPIVLLLFIRELKKSQTNITRKAYGMGALLLVTSISLMIPFGYMIPIPRDGLVTMPLGAQAHVVKEVVTTQPLFGVGPLHTGTAYFQHKPVGINETIFWNQDLYALQATALEVIASVGIIGAVTLFFIISLFAWYTYQRLRRWIHASFESEAMYEVVYSMSAILCGAFILSWFHAFGVTESLVLLLLFVLTLQVIVGIPQPKKITAGNSMLLGYITSIAIVALVFYGYHIPKSYLYLIDTQVSIEKVESAFAETPHDSTHVAYAVHAVLQQAIEEQKAPEEAIVEIERWYERGLEEAIQTVDFRILFASVKYYYQTTELLPSIFPTLYEEVRKRDPLNPEYPLFRAQVVVDEIRKNETVDDIEKEAAYVQANALLEEAVALQKTNYTTYVRYGQVQDALGNREVAQTAYTIAYQLNSNDPYLLLLLLDMFVEEGEKDNAEFIFEQVRGYLDEETQGWYEEAIIELE